MEIIAEYLQNHRPRLFKPEYSLSRQEMEELLCLIHYFDIQVEYYIHISCGPHCPKMEMNEEKTSKFKFHFPVLLVPYLMKKKLSEKSFVFGLPR